MKFKGLPSQKSRPQTLWPVTLSKGTTLQVSASNANACELGQCSCPGTPAHQERILAIQEREETSQQRCRGVRVDTVVATTFH